MEVTKVGVEQGDYIPLQITRYKRAWRSRVPGIEPRSGGSSWSRYRSCARERRWVESRQT